MAEAYEHLNRADRIPYPDSPPVVRLRGITKRFGKVLANDDISLSIKPGRIKALLGENGAGKSTLMSMLAGRYTPDSGILEIEGQAVRFSSAKDGIAAGIGMVYQHFMLVETMTVAENVLLGQEGSFFISPREMEARVRELSELYGLKINPSAIVADLSMGEKQCVEILKLLYRNSRVLIFDEPTAVLTPKETLALFKALWKMAEQGKAIVFISHKLEEVLAVADEIAILRKGRIEGEFLESEITSKADLACRMVGREVLLEVNRKSLDFGETVLELRNFNGLGLKNINFSLHQGEILAIVEMVKRLWWKLCVVYAVHLKIPFISWAADGAIFMPKPLGKIPMITSVTKRKTTEFFKYLSTFDLDC